MREPRADQASRLSLCRGLSAVLILTAAGCSGPTAPPAGREIGDVGRFVPCDYTIVSMKGGPLVESHELAFGQRSGEECGACPIEARHVMGVTPFASAPPPLPGQLSEPFDPKAAAERGAELDRADIEHFQGRIARSFKQAQDRSILPFQKGQAGRCSVAAAVKPSFAPAAGFAGYTSSAEGLWVAKAEGQTRTRRLTIPSGVKVGQTWDVEGVPYKLEDVGQTLDIAVTQGRLGDVDRPALPLRDCAVVSWTDAEVGFEKDYYCPGLGLVASFLEPAAGFKEVKKDSWMLRITDVER